jgi:hypothetical protein
LFSVRCSFETIYDRPIHLFRLVERLPRAYAVSGRAVARPPEAYELLGSTAFDLRRSVILPEGAEREPRDGFSSEVRLLWRRTASVGLAAELSHDGVVVLLDGWYPGWSVSVDGEPAELLRANVLFRGVAVAAGSHRIVFRYAPRAVSWGAWTTAATLAMLGVGGLTRLRRRDA